MSAQREGEQPHVDEVTDASEEWKANLTSDLKVAQKALKIALK